jgi:hypothetical protein
MAQTYAAFRELPLTSIRPQGWLREFLVRQRDGLTGHIDEQFFPWNTCGWTGVIPEKKLGHAGDWWDPWWPYEQSAYLYDGQMKCGALLEDAFLLEKARKQTIHVREHQATDGYLGPEHIRHTRWPHVVFFRSFMAEHSAFGGDDIVAALLRFYEMESKGRDFGHGRDVCHVEGMCWVHEKTGRADILELAEKTWDAFEKRNFYKSVAVSGMLSPLQPFEHGVTFFETMKLPAMLYARTGKKQYLRAAENALEKVDRFHMLPDGVPTSEEYLNGHFVSSTHETCDITDYTWAAGYVLLASGSAKWADRIERACFNAGPGAVTADFSAHQYLSCVNQVVSNGRTCHDEYRLQYRGAHPTLCCSGNVNRFMPNYAARMWLAADEGIVAALYGPSEVSFEVSGEAVRLTEQTDYPFSDEITFKVSVAAPVRFALRVRIPGWCQDAAITVNGKPTAYDCVPETFVAIEREFRDGDEIRLRVPMALELHYWPDAEEGGKGIRLGASLSYGPLCLAHPVKTDRTVDSEPERFTIETSSKEYPAWDLRPAGEWRYGLENTAKLLEHCEVSRAPLAGFPFDDDAKTLRVRVPARLVVGWDLAAGTHDGQRSLTTPPLPAGPIAGEKQSIELVPYGSTRLRVTVFPVLL